MAKRRLRSSQTSANVADSDDTGRKSVHKPFITKRRSSFLSKLGFSRPLVYVWPLLLLSVLFYFLIRRHWLHVNTAIPTVGESELSVYDRGLVKSDITYEEVLAAANRAWVNKTERHFKSMVLAYVTPWNGKGYDMAKTFRAKFTHVSPVWYQLKRDGTELQLMGRHDADQEWIAEVRKDGQPLILPRFILEASPVELLTKKRQRKHAIDLIVSECKTMGYDGLVLEAWSTWTAYGILKHPSLRQMALNLIEELTSALHTAKTVKGLDGTLQMVFVIPPPNSNEYDPNMFTSSDMARLGGVVDGFSLMTYDFSSAYHPGPNAPLAWVRACLQILLPGSPEKQQTVSKMNTETTEDKLAKKVLMGVNFYGNDYVLPRGGGPILGHEYLSLLRTQKPKLFWDKESGEHYFDYEEGLKRHRVFYPSLKSISLRLEEAQAWGVGLSIWEIGQGVEYFFDLL